MSKRGSGGKIKTEGIKLLKQAHDLKVSDLYLLPNGDRYQLLFRKHHDVIYKKRLKTEEAEKLLLYYKYLSGMDVSEKRKVQLGSATVRSGSENIRIRLSSVADFMNRETLVIRLLYTNVGIKDVSFLYPDQLQELSHAIRGTGMYLFSGPTGSGKSTTMNLLAQHVIKAQSLQHVMTIEDPVELIHSDFTQLQVNQKIGLTYPELIKVCLRHRPDVLIIGEIRDEETAQMAMRAALTGHLVFSTIHAFSKEGMKSRLLDLNVKESQMDECVKGYIYQELLPINRAEEYGVLFDYSLSHHHTKWEHNLRRALNENIIKETTYHRFK